VSGRLSREPLLRLADDITPHRGNVNVATTGRENAVRKEPMAASPEAYNCRETTFGELHGHRRSEYADGAARRSARFLLESAFAYA
jgi:hypothetical protein